MDDALKRLTVLVSKAWKEIERIHYRDDRNTDRVSELMRRVEALEKAKDDAETYAAEQRELE